MESDISQLFEQLKDPRAEQRLAATVALGEVDHFNANAIPRLVEVLGDAEKDIRLASIASMMSIWRSLAGDAGDMLAPNEEIDLAFEPLSNALKTALRDEDKQIRFRAAVALRDLFCTDQAVFEALVEAAHDEDESLRERAAQALWLGASDRRATLFQVETEAGIAVLSELLQDTSRNVRGDALRAIGSIGPLAQSAAPMVQKLLQDDDEEIRFNAAVALARLGDGAQAALPILAETLTNGDRLRRKAAAFALRTMGVAAKPALPALINGLKDREKRVRSRCADTLGKIGAPISDDAIHALLEAERDEDSDVRRAVEMALAAIGKEEVQAAQKRTAQSKARDFFPLFGFKPDEIPGLISMLKDPNSNARAMAATALGHLGAREAVPDLLELLNDEDDDVRRRATHTLQNMGVNSEVEDV
jgi:HEAT repeat protein